MDNVSIARALGELADLLEIQGSNPFRVRAYRNAARTVETLATPVAGLVGRGDDLTTLPGIGKEMAAHLTELATTGNCSVLDQLCRLLPRELLGLTRLPGVGPKKARILWQELGIDSLEALEAAGKAGKLALLAGFGEKTEQKILRGLEQHRRFSARHKLVDADRLVEPLLERLGGAEGLERLEVAGSYRRRRETVGDIDLLAAARSSGAVNEGLLSYPGVEETLAAGDTKSSVLLAGGLQVDLRVVEPESHGAALVYFTGSQAHNVKLRQRARGRGLKLSEYGVFRTGNGALGRPVAGASEEEVYAALGLPWIPPELREDRGEVERAEEGTLPLLVEQSHLRGDLHLHTVWSDGKGSVQEMVRACAGRGYEYLAITDHSRTLAMTGGLDAVRLRRQWEEVARVQEAEPGIRILRGMEVDILADGSLDLEDELLAGLDLVIVSVHSRFGLSRAEQTARVLRALAHPEVNLLAHPTGRLINRRDPYQVDLDEVLASAAENRVAVELNSNPNRLDLKDSHLMEAKRRGLKVAINSDAHSVAGLELIRYGVEQGRRGWLEPGDVLNALALGDLLAVLAKE
ncbi:MAG: DNA polymerase/3'-5' exonuclease PolX [Longimicrobiaceae bacterium]